MEILKRLQEGTSKLAVVGLGYVGLPLAAAFAACFSVIGFDQNEEKLKAYRRGEDVTEEIGNDALKEAVIEFTSDPARLSEACFIIVSVPTPINRDKTPDLDPVQSATRTVAKYLSAGSIVVYESTVYPGVTEDVCKPVLEKVSGLVCGKDFKIGYSPERINPGDRKHRLKNIVKIVAGMDAESRHEIAAVYQMVIDHVYEAPDIRVAEAAKLVENAQRDINIAFMNELSIVFHRMGIDTDEVAKAMDTKWNALGFRPGLVGGHCIGVDPHYFIYEAETLGYYSQIIAAGRHVNDGMSDFVAQETVKTMLRAGVDASHAKVFLLGMTFKEDCPDTRNSRSVDIYRRLEDYGLHPQASDAMADPEAFWKEYGIRLVDPSQIVDADCLVFLVAHEEYRHFSPEDIGRFYGNPGKKKILVDVKAMYSRQEFEARGYFYWRL